MASLLFWCSLCVEINSFKTIFKGKISLTVYVISYGGGVVFEGNSQQLSEFSIHVTIVESTQKSVEAF